MKWTPLVLSLLVLLFAEFPAHAASNGANSFGDLELAVVGLESDDGKVQIALYQADEGKPFEGEPFRKASVEIASQRARCVFERIPFGDYGVKVYHDANANGKLDTNFMGIPKEAYGFSNNARGTFGPPKDDKIRFAFQEAILRMEITVK